MLETPQIVQTVTRPIAVIHITIPKTEIRAAMGPGLSELMGAVAAQGVAPAGPWFTHHLRIDPDIWDFELSVPVATPVVAHGRVNPGQWPGMKVVRTVYHGPYEGLGAAWGEFNKWILVNGHTTTDELWECYLSVPGSEPTDLRTELTKKVTG